ncbi:MAG: saccharopine dehydrogenase NADP-binding domain-containing protein [Desulfobacterales bacterium]
MEICILGAGKVGGTIAAMLESCDFCKAVHLADSRPPAALPPLAKTRVESFDFADPARLKAFIGGKDAVVSAAPFYLNRDIAAACARAGVAYFDLTEDVETTSVVRRLAEKGKVPFMPQCGLAPGAINIIGASLAAELPALRSLELRVGALPLYASNAMKYYLSWNTAGLINEYCNLCEVICGGRRLEVEALDGYERLTLDGTEYEAFYTSGGVGTLCETYEGRVRELNYKTIRYPGHRDLMKFLLYDLNLIDNRKLLTEIFDQEVPVTETDVVIIYVNVVGQDESGVRQRSFAKKIYGDLIDGRRYSAIQLSTAAGLVAVLELYARGKLGTGFVKQESVAFADFLSTRWGGRIYAGEERSALPAAR